MENGQDARVLVPGVHRAIRTLAAGEGPWPGTLVDAGGGSVAVWCSLEESEAALDWRFAGAEHVLAPADIARSVAGQAALMPWCTMSVTAFLARRAAAAEALTPGEWVTLTVSILRGLREISDRAEPGLAGRWWLTDEGRPVCVPGGAGAARPAAADALAHAETTCADRALRKILVGIADAVRDGTPTGVRVRAWERELLEFAAPRPLRMDAADPDAEHPSAVHQLRADARDAPARRRRVRDRRALGVLPALSGSVRAGIGGMSAMLPAARVRRRVSVASSGPSTPEPRSRRRLVVVGAIVAAAVLGAGLLWPSDADPPSQARAEPVSTANPDPTENSAASDAVGTGEAGPIPGGTVTGAAADAVRASASADAAETDAAAEEESPDEGVPADAAAAEDPTTAAEDPPSESDAAPADPAAAADVLIRVLDECAGRAEDTCPAAIAAGSSARAQDVLRADAAGTAVLVDDYGDLAVVRLGEPSAGEQMLVLVRREQKWLVRDVYDVADQPEN